MSHVTHPRCYDPTDFHENSDIEEEFDNVDLRTASKKEILSAGMCKIRKKKVAEGGQFKKLTAAQIELLAKAEKQEGAKESE